MNGQKPRVVVVTGASAGVGRAAVRELAARGDSIGLIARGSAGLEGAQRDVEALGGRALAIETDVADPAAVESAAALVEAQLGPIDAWVNSAMASLLAPVRQARAEEIRRVTDVTYLGTVHGTLAALKRMLPRDSGVIVQVGSALAYRSIPLQSAYCGAKHAVLGFTDSLRSELIHDRSNVKVTVVQLPALNTPQFDWVRSRLPKRAQPVPPIYQPEVAARAIVRAIDHPSREVFVGVPTVLAIQGHKLLPGLLDRYLAATAYDGQQTDEIESPHRSDNLFAPINADLGAHGRFDEAAIPDRPITQGMRRAGISAAAAAAVGALAIGLLASRDRRS